MHTKSHAIPAARGGAKCTQKAVDGRGSGGLAANRCAWRRLGEVLWDGGRVPAEEWWLYIKRLL